MTPQWRATPEDTVAAGGEVEVDLLQMNDEFGGALRFVKPKARPGLTAPPKGPLGGVYHCAVKRPKPPSWPVDVA
jgi:hypothetical protein